MGKQKTPVSKTPTVKPTHKAVKAYYATLVQHPTGRVRHPTDEKREAARRQRQTMLRGG